MAPLLQVSDLRTQFRTDDGLLAAQEIRRRHPDIGVIVLSHHLDSRYAIKLLEEAPDAMRATGVTALLVDQGQPAGSTIAERLPRFAGIFAVILVVCSAVTLLFAPAPARG